MGILKYHSPHSTYSIKIKIELNKEEQIFNKEMIQKFQKFKYILSKTDNSKTKNEKKMSENYKIINYPKGEYYLTLYYQGLLKDMSNLFEDCSSFTEIDLSEFNTYKVEKMNETFKKCSGLKKVKFPKCNTSNVEEMNSLFDECNNLEEIDFANFNGKKLKKYDNIFGSLNVKICKNKKEEEKYTNVRTNDKTIRNIIDKRKNAFSTEESPIVELPNVNNNPTNENQENRKNKYNEVISIKPTTIYIKNRNKNEEVEIRDVKTQSYFTNTNK